MNHLQALDRTNKQLKKDLEVNAQALQIPQRLKDGFRWQVYGVRIELATTEEKLKVVQKELDESKNTLDQLTVRNKHADADRITAQLRMQNAQRELAATMTELDKTRIKLTEREIDLQRTKTELQNTKTELEKARTELKQVKAAKPGSTAGVKERLQAQKLTFKADLDEKIAKLKTEQKEKIAKLKADHAERIKRIKAEADKKKTGGKAEATAQKRGSNEVANRQTKKVC